MSPKDKLERLKVAKEKEPSTLTKQDMIEEIARRLGAYKSDAATWVELAFETVKSSLASGKEVKISGFGRFQVREKRARPGRNPKTREPINISARRVVTFHASAVLKSEMNRKGRP